MRGPLGAIYEAIADSFLAGLPSEVLEALLGDSRLVHAPAGVVVAREGDERIVAVLVSGTARAFVSSDRGRQLDIRQLHPGDAFGVSALAEQRNVASLQAMVGSDLLRLDPESLLRLGACHQPVAWAIAKELSRRSDDIVGEYRARAFGAVRQRLARYLLDHSTVSGDGSVVFHVSRQEMADAIGTSRRVVLRELALLREIDILSFVGGRHIVIDPARLHAVARGARQEISLDIEGLDARQLERHRQVTEVTS